MEESPFNYFHVDEAVTLHDVIIDESGGMHGVRDRGALESILDHVQNDFYYPSFEDKLTHLFFSINKIHAFSDGNKRASIVLSALFLELNGLDGHVDVFITAMEEIAVWVADGAIDKSLLLKILCDFVAYCELSEEVRLEMITVISAHNSKKVGDM